MPVTYENIAFDRVLKGVETILEADFKNEAIVYLSKNYEAQRGKSIRLLNLPSEQLTRNTNSVVDLFPVEISCYVPVSAQSERENADQMAELTARVKRLLNNNRTYRVSGAYKWHDGTVDIDPDPERLDIEDGGEPGPEVMAMSRIIFGVTVEEVF